MNEETFNLELRKFLKKVGVTSQRKIEKVVAAAIEAGQLSGNETLDASVTLEIPALNLRQRIDGRINLG
jgi:ribosomal protein L1